MSRAVSKIREQARRLFLIGESSSNAEIARHIGAKPHTIGRWRREEHWDDLKLKVDRRAAEKLVELEPDDPLSHTNLSRILMQKGLIPEAEDASARAMGLQMKGGP